MTQWRPRHLPRGSGHYPYPYHQACSKRTGGGQTGVRSLITHCINTHFAITLNLHAFGRSAEQYTGSNEDNGNPMDGKSKATESHNDHLSEQGDISEVDTHYNPRQLILHLGNSYLDMRLAQVSPFHGVSARGGTRTLGAESRAAGPDRSD